MRHFGRPVGFSPFGPLVMKAPEPLSEAVAYRWDAALMRTHRPSSRADTRHQRQHHHIVCSGALSAPDPHRRPMCCAVNRPSAALSATPPAALSPVQSTGTVEDVSLSPNHQTAPPPPPLPCRPPWWSKWSKMLVEVS